MAAEPAPRKLVESDKVEFVVGPIFSNVLGDDLQTGDVRQAGS